MPGRQDHLCPRLAAREAPATQLTPSASVSFQGEAKRSSRCVDPQRVTASTDPRGSIETRSRTIIFTTERHQGTQAAMSTVLHSCVKLDMACGMLCMRSAALDQTADGVVAGVGADDGAGASSAFATSPFCLPRELWQRVFTFMAVTMNSAVGVAEENVQCVCLPELGPELEALVRDAPTCFLMRANQH